MKCLLANFSSCSRIEQIICKSYRFQSRVECRSSNMTKNRCLRGTERHLRHRMHQLHRYMKTFRFKRGIKNISEASTIILSKSSRINKKWWSLEWILSCIEMILTLMTSRYLSMNSRYLRSSATNSQVDPFSMAQTQIG